jgi:hypothetical protein
MNRIIFGLMAVGLVAGPVVAGAQAREPDNIRLNWADSWKSAVVAPGRVAALASYEQVNRDSPRLIAAFKGGAYFPGQTFVSNASFVPARSVIGVASAPVTRAVVAPNSVAAPEIDPTSTAAGLTLLLGGMAILRGRRAKQGLD